MGGVFGAKNVEKQSYKNDEKFIVKKEVLQELKELKKDFRRLKRISGNKKIKINIEEKRDIVKIYHKEVRKMDAEKDKEMIQVYKKKLNDLKEFRDSIKKEIPGNSDKILRKRNNKEKKLSKRNIEKNKIVNTNGDLIYQEKNSQDICIRGENEQKIKKGKYKSIKEAAKAGDIEGVFDTMLDSTEMSPKRKGFWKGATRLGLTVGGIVIGIKWLKSVWAVIRGNEKKGKWATFLGIPAALFGIHAAGGLGNFLKKVTNKVTGEKIGEEYQETYEKGYLAITTIFGGMTGEQIGAFVEKDNNGGIKMKSGWAEELSILYKDKVGDRANAVKKILKMRKKKRDRMMSLALVGMYGSYVDFENKKEEKVDNILKDNYKNINAMVEYMSDNNYKEIKIDEHKKEISQYIRSGSPSLEELEDRGVFMKEEFPLWEALEDKTGTDTKKLLETTNLSLQEKITVQTGINELYEKIDSKSKAKLKLKLKIDPKGNIIGLSSYGQSLKLNYTNKKIKGLDMDLKNIDELFKTANLINKIKSIVSKKTPRDSRTSPFELGISNSLNFRSIADPWYDDLTIFRNYRPFYHGSKYTASSLGNSKGMKVFTEYLNNWWNTENLPRYTNGLKIALTNRKE